VEAQYQVKVNATIQSPFEVKEATMYSASALETAVHNCWHENQDLGA
jgi:hypothetical protein